MKKTITSFIILASLILMSADGVAQRYTRFSLNGSVGNTQMLSSLSAGTAATGNIALSFTLTHLFSAEGELESGSINGSTKVYRENAPQYVANFNTSYTYKGGNVYLNLQKLFMPRRRNVKVSAFIFAGAGFMDYEAKRFSQTGTFEKRYLAKAYTTKAGMKLKVKMNDYFDIHGIAEINMPQSFYVDASPVPAGYDYFTGIKIGVSYKIGAAEKRQHIDWSPNIPGRCKAWRGAGCANVY